MKRIDEKTKNQIARIYSGSDLAIHEISHIFNVSEATIYNIIKEKDIPQRRQTPSDSALDTAVNMYIQGYYVQQIFDDTHVSPLNLYAELDSRGIPRRNIKLSSKKYYRKSKYADEVIELYQEGKSAAEISLKLSTTTSTVYRIVNYAKKLGVIEARPSDIQNEIDMQRTKDIAKVYHLLTTNEKITIRKLAQEMGICEKKLSYAIRRCLHCDEQA